MRVLSRMIESRRYLKTDTIICETEPSYMLLTLIMILYNNTYKIVEALNIMSITTLQGGLG